MNGRRVEYCALTLHRLWASGASYSQIAAALGCSDSMVHKLKIRHKLEDRQKPTKKILEDDPTPEQIAEIASELRKRHLAERRSEAEDASRSRACRANKQVSDAIRRYSWDGFRFSSV